MGIERKDAREYNLLDEVDKDLRNLKGAIEASNLTKEKIETKFSTLAEDICNVCEPKDDIWAIKGEDDINLFRSI